MHGLLSLYCCLIFRTYLSHFLALKVILVCFERQLGSQWYWLSLQVKEMALRKVGGLALWDFLDFIVRTRIPIFVLLRPFIQCKVIHYDISQNFFWNDIANRIYYCSDRGKTFLCDKVLLQAKPFKSRNSVSKVLVCKLICLIHSGFVKDRPHDNGWE